MKIRMKALAAMAAILGLTAMLSGTALAKNTTTAAGYAVHVTIQVQNDVAQTNATPLQALTLTTTKPADNGALDMAWCVMTTTSMYMVNNDPVNTKNTNTAARAAPAITIARMNASTVDNTALTLASQATMNSGGAEVFGGQRNTTDANTPAAKKTS